MNTPSTQPYFTLSATSSSDNSLVSNGKLLWLTVPGKEDRDDYEPSSAEPAGNAASPVVSPEGRTQPVSMAEEIAAHLEKGGEVQLSFREAEGSAREFRLRDLTQDAATGQISHILVEDAAGTQSLPLSYDAESGRYQLPEGPGGSLESYTLLATPARAAASAAPAYTLRDMPAATSATAAAEVAAALSVAASRASYIYAWALGLTVQNNSITGGYYDADKINGNSGGVDCDMCWAGTASNMIAWWQNYYGAHYYVGTSPALSADAIFDQFRAHWENEGGWAEAGCQWWLAGGAYTDVYGWLLEDHGKTYQNGAGYYKSMFDEDSVKSICYAEGVTWYSALDVANRLTNKLEGGCAVGFAIAGYEKYSPGYTGRHALTLWGVTKDAATGYITALHYTDSNYGREEVVVSAVSYNSSEGCYQLLEGDYKGWLLDEYQVLEPLSDSNKAVLNPKQLTQSQNGSTISFSWSGTQYAGVTYEVAYQRSVDSSATFVKVSGKSLSVNLSQSGDYLWWVRAVAGNRVLTDWVRGSDFSCDFTPPQLSFTAPTLVRAGDGLTKVTFSWSVDETSSQTLVINGELVYSGTGTGATRSFTLGDGSYTYTLTVKDSLGNSTVKQGSFVCDASPVPTPSDLLAQLSQQGGQVTLSWDAVDSRNGVSYEVGIKTTGQSSYELYTTESTSLVLNLLVTDSWTWRVRTVDSNGYTSSWVTGQTFNNDVVPPDLTLSPTTWRVEGPGATKVTFRWACEEEATFTLVLDGEQVYSGKLKGRSFTLADGLHKYTVTATDAAGNVRVRNGSFRCDTKAPSRPSALNVAVENKGKQINFSWKGVSDISGVTYELQIKKAGETEYKRYGGTLTEANATIKLSGTSTKWYWRVRAVDGRGNVSKWASGKVFNNDFTAPKITVTVPTPKKVGTRKSTGTLSWTSNEKATYVLKINGEEVYSGSGRSYKYTLADGYHRYELTATDTAGNVTVKKGAFRCDTVAPAKPSGLSVELQNKGKKGVFSWKAVTDISGVTYELELKAGQNGTYTNYSGSLSTTSATVSLSTTITWYWRVRAVDGRGNASAWVSGKAFHNDLAGPKVTLVVPTPKKVSTRKSTGTLSWSADEKASYVLKINGKQVYKGSGSSYKYTLADGYHRYELTATDARGNTTVKKGAFRCDTVAPSKPTGLKVSVSDGGEKAVFTWNTVTDVSGVTYEFELRKQGASTYTNYGGNLDSATITMNLGGLTTRYWRVRAVDGRGNASAWVQGTSFINDVVAPTLTASDPVISKVSNGRISASFSGTSDEKATFVLKIDGKTVHSASGTSYNYSYTLADGTHEYSLTATDAAGNSSSKSGSFTFDATAPDAPGGLSVKVTNSGSNAVFTWNSVTDLSGVTYEFELRKDSASTYTRYGEDLESPTITMTLGGMVTRHWRVRAVDGKGNASAWVQGTSFNNSGAASAPVPTSAAASALRLDQELSLSTGLPEEAVASLGTAACGCAGCSPLADLQTTLEDQRRISLAASL